MNNNDKISSVVSEYPPISDYAFISDCHSVALISKSCSIDWCCMPRIDSSSCFGRILDWKQGGYCRILPVNCDKVERQYKGNSLILETIFHSPQGKIKLTDCFTMHEGGEHYPHRQILRIIEGIDGDVECQCDIEPRFDYGEVKPWIRRINKNSFSAIGGNSGLLIMGDLEFNSRERHSCHTHFTIKKGEKRRLSISFLSPEVIDELSENILNINELDRRFEETIEWWENWKSQGNYDGLNAEQAYRSAIVLKGLSNAPTGAIAAAATTSLPEEMHGSRNWDYRFSWIRDSVFTLRSLNELGYNKEADGFRRFVERSSAGSAEEIQVLFGVGGECRLPEAIIGKLEGYRCSQPVRIGNAAVKQTQLDIFGELLELSWRWHHSGNSIDHDYWLFITELVEQAIDLWKKPDCGIWEIRGAQRHFVLSKAMCWVTLDRAIKLADGMHKEHPKKRWEKIRDEIYNRIMQDGVDKKRQIFKQAFDNPIADASLLLLPVFGFVKFNDKLMIRTTEFIRDELQQDGLIKRYPSGSDNLDGGEGVFIACTFWLVECLAAQGKLKEAWKFYTSATSTANDLGLFSEEYDVPKREMLGNFPQALTHLSHIAAIVALDRAEADSR